MGKKLGDFIGFTFNGVHSSELGLVRTDNGGRFTESLLPTSQDKTVVVPGGDGTYYFNSYYTQRPFSIAIAFDSITEEQLRRIRSLFGDKKPRPLIFDELPYKVYTAKVTGIATIKYICFDEGPTHRLYKGEGDIQFTAYQPYAKVCKKFLEEYSDTNKQEWAAASGLLSTRGNYDKFSTGKISLYNPGDLPSDWKLKLKFIKSEVANIIPALTIRLGSHFLQLDQIEAKHSNRYSKNDDFIQVNSKNNLIEGYCYDNQDLPQKSGNIYNEYIMNGEFFNIPVTSNFSTGIKEEIQMLFQSEASLDQVIEEYPLSYSYYYY